MNLITIKTSLENILWSGLTVLVYVKHKTGEEFNYQINYEETKNQCIRYSVEFLTDIVCFETITQVLNFIECYDLNSVDSVEIEITN